MKFVYLMICFSFLLSACRNNEAVRWEYQEKVVQPQDAAFKMPSNHPPDSHAATGNAKTAQIASGLPEGHPPIGDMNDPAMKKLIAGSVVEAPVAWVTPDGWTEISGDGMRLATLKSPDGLAQVAVTSFSGSAGGVEGNVVRWLAQMGMELDDAALKDFIARSETVVSTGGLNVRIFRFTSLAPEADLSMIAAMTEIPGATVFFKMTGTAKDLEDRFLSFHELCQSLELK